MNYTSNARRHLARSIDGVLMVALFILTFWAFAALAEQDADTERSQYFFYALLAIMDGVFLVLMVPLKFGGATLTMRVLKQRMVLENGQPLTWWAIFKREAFSFVSAMTYGLGYIWALWHPKNQTWHDRFAGTVVIEDEA